MPFQLVFRGGPTLDLNNAFFVRELGTPVQWRFISELKRGDYGGTQEADFVRLMLGGAVDVQALWQPGSIVICPGARVVGVSRPAQTGMALIDWSGYVSRLDVIAESTAPVGSGVSPFIPRRRVHKPNNMQELVDQFKHIAEPIQRVKNELGKLRFPDQDKASIIQDGVSDWSFFGHILDECRFMARDANWLPLTLVGGVDENAGTAGRWVVAPGVKAPYVQWNDVASRRVSFEESDGPERVQFGQIAGTSRVPAFPSAQFPTVGIGRPWRKFQADRWHQWRNQDLPLFTAQGDMVWRTQDRISRSDQDDIGWETFIFAAPPETQVVGPLQASRLCPWIGVGKVKQSSQQEPWIQVELEGFEDGANLADVRLSTPFSGTDGKKGLHLVPEQGTKVEVCWTGRFDASVVLVGNTRWDPADFGSPSVFLEATHTAQYADVHIKRIGDVTVDSSLSVAIKQNTSVNSQQPLKIHADGADLKMNGGVVYTGRGL